MAQTRPGGGWRGGAWYSLLSLSRPVGCSFLTCDGSGEGSVGCWYLTCTGREEPIPVRCSYLTCTGRESIDRCSDLTCTVGEGPERCSCLTCTGRGSLRPPAPVRCFARSSLRTHFRGDPPRGRPSGVAANAGQAGRGGVQTRDRRVGTACKRGTAVAAACKRPTGGSVRRANAEQRSRRRANARQAGRGGVQTRNSGRGGVQTRNSGRGRVQTRDRRGAACGRGIGGVRRGANRYRRPTASMSCHRRAKPWMQFANRQESGGVVLLGGAAAESELHSKSL
jgi:hypothetical protein